MQPVDVIFRRLDDSFCDPLELRSDSSLGVAGLVEAARAGNVAIANALGSGVIETAAIMPFLPRLCRHLLGEELMLPSVRHLVVRPAGGACSTCSSISTSSSSSGRSRRTAREPVFGRKLSAREKSALLGGAARAARPTSSAQEQVALSTAPVWHQHRLEPRPVVFRDLRRGRRATRYAVMPGGLTRVSSAQRRADRVDAARRRQQRHLGAVGRTR